VIKSFFEQGKMEFYNYKHSNPKNTRCASKTTKKYNECQCHKEQTNNISLCPNKL